MRVSRSLDSLASAFEILFDLCKERRGRRETSTAVGTRRADAHRSPVDGEVSRRRIRENSAAGFILCGRQNSYEFCYGGIDMWRAGTRMYWVLLGLLLLGCRPAMEGPVVLPAKWLLTQPATRIVLQSENPERSVSETFAIESRSSEPLTLKLQGTSCGCTSVSWAGKKLVKDAPVAFAPQQKQEFVIAADIGGSDTKNLVVTFQESTTPEPILVNWRVSQVRDLLITDSVIRVSPRSTSAAFIAVVNHRPGGSRKLSLAGNPQAVTLSATPTGKPTTSEGNIVREEFECQLAWTAPGDPGTSVPLVVQLLGENAATVGSVPIRLQFLDDRVLESPKRINLGLIDVGSRKTSTFLVRSVDRHPFAITGQTVESLDGQVILPTAPAAIHILKAEIHATASGPLKGQIRLQTDCPEQTEILIAVEGLGVEKKAQQTE